MTSVGDAELMSAVDEMVTGGALERSGRRLRLAEHNPMVGDPEMRERVERLMSGLSAAGASPPRADAVAGRLGVPPAMLDGLRASGALVRVADGIDYPAPILQELQTRIDALARRHSVTVAAVRDELRTSRRHAEALIAYRRRRPRSSGERSRNATP